MPPQPIETTIRLDSQHNSFERVKAGVVTAILKWESQEGGELNLEIFSDCVYIEDSSGLIVRENQSFRTTFGSGATLFGRTMRRDEVVRNMDAILMLGNPWIECRHFSSDALGRICELQTFKRRLDDVGDPELCILGITRVIRIVDEDETVRQLTLKEQFAMYKTFDEVDHTICAMFSAGETTKDIAETVGLTTKSIENRRNRMMRILGLSHPIEIVKFLVRLEENGLISRNE